MDTDGLRLFLLAAEKLNISAAGQTLGFAPAVASAKLAKLEKAVGADLLHRSTRKVALSLEGSDFLPYAREMVAQEDAGLAALGFGTACAKGTLRFAAPSSFFQLYIAPILPIFLDANPEVKLDLRLSDTGFDLIEGSFDLALRNMSMQNTSFKGRKLAQDIRILCASPSYLDRHGVPEAPKDLSQHQLIAFSNDKPRRLTGADGAVDHFDPSSGNCRLIIDDGFSQKQATVAGCGVSANSLWSVHSEITNGQLIHVLPEYTVADDADLWLVYPKANVLSAKVRVFIDFLLNQIARSPPWT